MPESTNIDCSWPAIAEPCERPIGKLTTLCTSAWQPHEPSIVVRVSTPSLSTRRRDVGLLHEVPGHQLASSARAASSVWPG